ncbi:MAG: hypothetical protein ACYSWP_06940, partial [Planctomycetota bacterium]
NNNDGGYVRRDVVSEFGLASHHVLDGTVTDADCAVCHYEAIDTDYHKDNTIDLRDPDDGTDTTLISIGTLTRNRTVDTIEPNVVNVQDNFCMKCHDTDGATATAVDGNFPLLPFSDGTTVPIVFEKFDTTNDFFHPVRGAGSNPFCNSTTMVSPWNQSADEHNVISCFDCHIIGHGTANQRMVLDAIDFAGMEAATEVAQVPASVADAIDGFCGRCHSSSVYITGNTGSIFEFHGEDQGQHASSGSNVLGCMGCHAGTVELHNETYSNGAAKGLIHGGSFTWPSGSMSQEPAITFVLGGWIDNYKTEGKWSSKNNYWQKACGGGKCNHSGGTQYWTPVAD